MIRRQTTISWHPNDGLPSEMTHHTFQSAKDEQPSGSSELGVAGALGFEPRLSVLETDVLPLTPCPYSNKKRGGAS
jgi:hypothetical protein